MTTNPDELFEAFLNQHDDCAWKKIIQAVLPQIHEVDRAATQIWFKFFPLALLRALQFSPDPAALAIELQLAGKYYLKDQIDESHRFLFGHRYWPAVRAAVGEYATAPQAPSSLDLSAQIVEVAARVAKNSGAELSLLVGITAVGFMTLQQVGVAEFTAEKGRSFVHPSVAHKSPAQILRERARGDGQGIFGFLRGHEKRFTVTFDENDPQATFGIIATQPVTNGAANDKRDYCSREPRCIPGEGPIPVQCRCASCGTCWVGVLAGAERLSEVGGLESRRIKEFGYIDTDEPAPLIRLACQAQAMGAVSIVIPPWNGVFGKYLLRMQQEEDQSEHASSFE